MTPATKPTPSLVPTMRYTDAPAAIAWLRNAFGFEEIMVVPGEGNTIAHAQLGFGHGMIMVGTARDDEYGQWVCPPAMLGGVGTQSVYVIVDDVDAHHARAVAAGAEVLLAPADQDYGGRLYSCRDPEGHIWNFGSYDPFAAT